MEKRETKVCSSKTAAILRSKCPMLHSMGWLAEPVEMKSVSDPTYIPELLNILATMPHLPRHMFSVWPPCDIALSHERQGGMHVGISLHIGAILN